MLRGVHRLADVGQPARHAGRCLVVDDENGADLAVGFQLRFDDSGIDSPPPVAQDHLDVEAEPPRHFRPQPSELAILEREHLVAGRQRVDQRRFPGARARCRKDHHRSGSSEDLLQTIEHLTPQRRELIAAVVDRRLRHRPQHAIRNVGRTRNLEEVPSASMHGDGTSYQRTERTESRNQNEDRTLVSCFAFSWLASRVSRFRGFFL